MATLSPLTQDSISLNPGYLRSKRILDILFTLVILLPCCLFMLIVAVMIRLDSDGPIFFRQRRVGLNGIEFDMFKFRSMYVHCDGSYELLLRSIHRGWPPMEAGVRVNKRRMGL
jgi:lipopolysaccharide/colanic/teichoic acid biosynthesis glycosyltransferase